MKRAAWALLTLCFINFNLIYSNNTPPATGIKTPRSCSAPLVFLKKHPKSSIASALLGSSILYTNYKLSQYAKQTQKTIEGYSSVDEWLTSGFEDKPTYSTSKFNIFSQNYASTRHLQEDNAPEPTARVNMFFPKQLYQGLISTTCVAHSLTAVAALSKNRPVQMQDLSDVTGILKEYNNAYIGASWNATIKTLLKMGYIQQASTNIFLEPQTHRPIYCYIAGQDTANESSFLKTYFNNNPSCQEVTILYVGPSIINIPHAMTIHAVYKNQKLNLYILDSWNVLQMYEKSCLGRTNFQNNLNQKPFFLELSDLGNNILLPLFENN